MAKIRDWSFPVALLVAWMAVSAYTLSELSELSALPGAPAHKAAPAARSNPTV